MANKSKRYTVGRGAYYGTPEDRADRWYVEDGESREVDRRGPGYRTRAEARRALDALLSLHESEAEQDALEGVNRA